MVEPFLIGNHLAQQSQRSLALVGQVVGAKLLDLLA
jgi:hypothetical protein